MSTEYLIIGMFIGLALVGGIVSYEVVVRRYHPTARAENFLGTRSLETREKEKNGFRKFTRLQIPLLVEVSKIIERIAPMGQKNLQITKKQLMYAGLSMTPETWRSLCVLALVVGFLGASFASNVFELTVSASIALLIVFLSVSLLMPRLVLSSKARNRRIQIEGRLPEAMELLGVALSAGAPVEQCFREISMSLDGPLSEEFAHIDQEVNLLGCERETALSNFSKRCNSRKVDLFVAYITQAIVQGSSVAGNLTRQATLLREEAHADKMERIKKMPTKLDIVLSVCFLPPTVALVVVPTVVDLLAFLNNTMG